MAENGNHILQTDKATIPLRRLVAVMNDDGRPRRRIYGLIGPNGAGQDNDSLTY